MKTMSVKYVSMISIQPPGKRSSDRDEFPIVELARVPITASYNETHVFATQTDRKNCPDKSVSRFDSNNLTNLRLYLNSEAFPYDDLNLDFDKNKYALLYDMYAKFGRSYYGHEEPLLNAIELRKYAPIAVIDCSRQNESLKSATVDVRIDFEFKENVPANTTAYCLMISDRIVEYNPLTNVVRKLM